MEGNTKSTSNIYLQSETLLSMGLLGVLVVILVPLPPVLLDMLLATNLSISILLLLITLGVTKPLEISVFPSLLLLLTLGRLSLNVATTRLILLDGDAGKIVSTFGGFVVGGNIIVGLVIFLILIVIQFIVITKGATRVSEVAARFTLDALPGKQMAIDAEMSTGTIDEETARTRRASLAQEAEFYGAMDGASKFVRGDAIAGLVITGINLVGGVVLGMTNGVGILEAVRRYSILTVGDGLVSQIPALIIATTAGILVTKATSKISLGDEIGEQLLKNTKRVASGRRDTGDCRLYSRSAQNTVPDVGWRIDLHLAEEWTRRKRRTREEEGRRRTTPKKVIEGCSTGSSRPVPADGPHLRGNRNSPHSASGIQAWKGPG